MPLRAYAWGGWVSIAFNSKFSPELSTCSISLLPPKCSTIFTYVKNAIPGPKSKYDRTGEMLDEAWKKENRNSSKRMFYTSFFQVFTPASLPDSVSHLSCVYHITREWRNFQQQEKKEMNSPCPTQPTREHPVDAPCSLLELNNLLARNMIHPSPPKCPGRFWAKRKTDCTHRKQ